MLQFVYVLHLLARSLDVFAVRTGHLDSVLARSCDSVAYAYVALSGFCVKPTPAPMRAEAGRPSTTELGVAAQVNAIIKEMCACEVAIRWR